MVLLSARLTPVAIAHLLKATSAGTILVSARCSRAAADALGSYGAGETAPTVLEPLSYERFLDAADPLGWAALEVPPTYSAVDEMDRNVLILHSSGTTGLPKPIYHPHKYLLGYANCHEFSAADRVDGVNCSTLPLFHGFGLLAPSLALSIGKPFLIPAAAVIPTATSTLALLHGAHARSLMTVPSVLEDLLHTAGTAALAALDFVAVGGGPMKAAVGEALVAAGVTLLNHMGATEIGAIAPIFIPGADYDWRYLQLRRDIGLRLDPAADGSGLYQLTGRPFGWGVDFPVQDLLRCNPAQPTTQFMILGRADDLLVLATGEKVLPRQLELAVANHPSVKDAVAFGDGRFNVGLIVEAAVAVDVGDRTQVAGFVDAIWPAVEAGNEFTDAHGKVVARSMVIVTTAAHKALARTDKGSLVRTAIVQAFAAEIDAAYQKSEDEGVLEMPVAADGGVGAWLRGLVAGVLRLAETEWSDQDDVFELGMDSLQATVLRRKIVAGISKAGGDGAGLRPDFIFVFPTLARMLRALTCTAPAPAGTREDRIKDMALKYTSSVSGLGRTSGAVVLLTGSTGSLGSFLLAQLAALPSVARVICLNRRSSRDLAQRQKQALERGGIVIPPPHWAKVVVLEADLKTAGFGLPDAVYDTLKAATHIVHNAWPMDFNRSLESFEPHFQATRNLVSLSLAANAADRRNVPRILFTSSVAVVGRYPALHGAGMIPETVMPDPDVTDHFGYPEAKWVCEQMLTEAQRVYSGRIETIIVRVGQLTGSESSGAWSPKEHFPSILKSAQTIGSLPAVQGVGPSPPSLPLYISTLLTRKQTLSWIPVDRAAKVIVELLLQPAAAEPVYHLENPVRQPWADVLSLLSNALGLAAVIPYEQWLDQVRALDDDAAGRLVKFLEEEFVSMASGTVVLDTKNARAASKTLAACGGIGESHVQLYVKYWRSVGHLA